MLLAALFSAVLVLIHHIHLLMYVPTIAAIVVLRHYLVQGVSRQNVAVGIALLAAVGVLFIAAQFYGTMAVPEAEFTAYLQSRMADPSRTDLLSFGYIWYQPLAKEVSDTWERLPHNLLGVPVFALLIWLHTPLWRYFRDLIAALSVDAHRRIVIAAIIVVSLGLSRDVRDGVRLFPLDFELGGVPVPDPACGEDAAGVTGRAADIGGRSKDDGVRLDRDADPARRDRAAVLIVESRPPHPHIQRALAAMADMRLPRSRPPASGIPAGSAIAAPGGAARRARIRNPSCPCR